jgi:uncharacterized linocin/CFP29 family protein
MKLIREEIEKVEVITEEKNGKKLLYIQGPFLQTEQKNRNGRVYRRSVMEREVKRYADEHISKGRALGELTKSFLLSKREMTSLVRHKSYQHQWVRLLSLFLKKVYV